MGFLVYYWFEQPGQQHVHHEIATGQPKTQELAKTLEPENTAGGGIIGPGNKAWLTEFSNETGKVSSRFKTQSFRRLPDGRFSVQAPIAELWTWSGEKLTRIVRIEGADGIVTTMHRKQEAEGLSGKQMDSPSSGELHLVTVRVIEPNALGKMKTGMVITMHDAWLLSGHCAHSFNCERWITGCGDCPEQRP